MSTRAAVERLQREGNWEALVRSASHRVPRAEAEDLVSRSFQRALEGLCTAQHVAAVHAWIAQDVRYALSHHYEHQRVVRKSLQVQGNAMPRPGERDDAETSVAQDANAELAAELLAEFSPRDQRILHLAWGEGEKRPTVAATLGVSERIVKRTLFNGGRRLESRLVDRLGGGCEGREEEFVRALAFNRANASERAQAILHMRSCDPCGELYGRLQEVRAGAAALVPAPLITGSGFFDKGQAFLEGATGWTREHAVRLHSRLVDLAATPHPLPRPGIVLANVGACAVAAGGTYCVSEIPPLKALSEPSARGETRPSPPSETGPPVEALVPMPSPPPAEPVEPEPAASPQEGQEPSASEPADSQPAPVPQPEFEPPAEVISGSDPSASSAPAPTPRPSSSSGADSPEFP